MTTLRSSSLPAARFMYRQLRRQPSWWFGHLAAIFVMIWAPMGASIFVLMGLPLLAIRKIPTHLPISRQGLLAWALLPSMLALGIGFGVSTILLKNPGFASIWVSGNILAPVSYEASGSPHKQLSVAPQLWKISTNKPTPIVLPTGKSITLPFHGSEDLGLYAYNPYWVSEKNGSAAVAFQIHRALQACCSVRFTEQQLNLHLNHPDGMDSLIDATRMSHATSLRQLLWRYWWLILGWVFAVQLAISQGHVSDPNDWKRLSFARKAKIVVPYTLGCCLIIASAAGTFVPLSSSPWLLWVALQNGFKVLQSTPILATIGGTLILGWAIRSLFRQFSDHESLPMA